MKNKGLRKAIQKVFKKDQELAFAVQEVEKYLIFDGFGWEEPVVSMCAGGELILTYKGGEMFHDEFIEIMETRGVIMPSDFRIF